MKYIILGFAMLASIGWHMLQPNTTKQNKLAQIQVHGKVQGLQGRLVLKIEDSYLNLDAYDRFTFLAQVASKERLTMQVVAQPEKQRCEVLKSNPTENIMHINISCQGITDNTAKNDTIVAL